MGACDVRIVGVHGVGNLLSDLSPEVAQDRIARQWSEALSRRLGGGFEFQLRAAYYADLLSPETDQSDGYPESLDPEAQQLIVDWLRALGATDETPMGPTTIGLRQAVDWIARKYGLDNRLTRVLVTTFCREVHAYFSRADLREAVTAAAAAAIRAHSPNVIIAHSLGSVVGYESLWRHPGLGADLLITIGSPLGMPDVIFDRLAPEWPGRPPGVARWINIADPGDFVAIPRAGLGSRFHGVTSDITNAIGAFSMHRATKYLACAAMAGAMAARIDT